MIKILQVGMGPLGQKTVKFALERGFKIVAACDPAPDKVGRDVGEVCGLKKIGVRIEPTVDLALKKLAKNKKPEIAVLTTVSSLVKLVPQVEAIAKKKLSIVSTCEELVYPWRTQPAVSKKLDKICKKYKIALLGTGVNPGFLMDYLPTVFTAVSQKVDGIRISRIQDASVRRIPFQQKIGAGLTTAEFRLKEKEGTLRHVGLAESLDLLANRMGWKLTKKTETLNPVIAQKDIASGYKPIPAGIACGVEQVAKGYVGEREVITLYFRAAVGEEKSFDTIVVEGEPRINTTIDGGVNGDIATCAITLNAIDSVLKSAPGLRTMSDVMPVTYFNSKR